jgi:hypothetical protein
MLVQNNLLNQHQQIFLHCYEIIVIFNYLFYLFLTQQINQKNYKQFLMEIYLNFNLIFYFFIIFIIFDFNILLIIDVVAYSIIIGHFVNLIVFSEFNFFAH